MIEIKPREWISHLSVGDTSVIIASDDAHSAKIIHWGAALPELPPSALATIVTAARPRLGDSIVNTSLPASVIPQLAEGWLGQPGLEGDRDGTSWAARFAVTDWHQEEQRLEITMRDNECQLEQKLSIELEASGLLRVQASVTNMSPEPYEVRSLPLSVPIPSHATEILDFAGGWANERYPQRMPMQVGRWARESRGGKPGLDGPLVMVAGSTNFDSVSGQVWGIHFGWSGNQVLAAERTFTDSRRLLAGELLYPGEVVLGEGESYQSPTLYASWGIGLNHLAGRFHAHARAIQPRNEPVPVLLNTWEATYFDHSFETFGELARAAAEIGVELFVVDDGWFGRRDDDHTSLGDWFVDKRKWPDGLRPLSDLVHQLGLKFGLWVEPEMVSLDSDLAREHPEWIFDAGHGPGLPSRYQHVLDLTHPEAFAWVSARLDALVKDAAVDYLKWDHNRYLLDAGQQRNDGRAGSRQQTLACYALMAQLKSANPGLRIESCAAGGGRIDLAMLEIADRVWPSDNNDPHERLRVQRSTGLLLPPEFQGTHIGAMRAHTTGRMSDLDFRAQVAIWGNLGLELNIAKLDPHERANLASWIAFHKQWRALLHSGKQIVIDRHDGSMLSGVVSPDQSLALFLFASEKFVATRTPAMLRFSGLRPEGWYQVRLEMARPHEVPPWAEQPEFTLPGLALMEIGVAAPELAADSAVIISLTADE